MRLTLVLCASLTACCSQVQQQDRYECPVWIVKNGPTDGLIHVQPTLAASLAALTPNGRFDSTHVCWYQKPSGHIEAYPWLNGYDVGYEFESTDPGWKFVKRNDYVVL